MTEPSDRKNEARPEAPRQLARRAAKREFLRVLRETRHARKAIRAVGYSWTTVYGWRARDARFRCKWDAIVASFPHELEHTAYRIALRGVEEDVYQGGKKVGRRRKVFPKLIMEMLRAHLPEKYGRALLPPPESRADPAEIAERVRKSMEAMDASVAAKPAPEAPRA